MSDYLNYDNIGDAVCKAIGDPQEANRDNVNMIINMVYLNEVCVCDDLFPLHWLMDLIDDVKTKNEATVTGISKAAAAVVTAAGHGLVTGDIIQFGTVTGMTELSNRVCVFVRTSADAGTLKDLSGTAINSTDFVAAGTAAKMYHRGVTLAKNFRTIKTFNFHGYSDLLTPIGMEEIESLTTWMDTGSESQPTRYLHKAYADTAGNEYQRLLWFTVPDTAYSARIWGEKIPSRLSNTTDVPVLPARFHDALISGCVSRLVEYGNIQIANAAIWPNLYRSHLDAIKNENREWWRKNDTGQRSPLYLL